MIDIGLGDKIIITSTLDAAIQELDILFNTTPTEFIGNPNYGVNFLQFLWQITPSTSLLEKYINEKILASTVYVKSLQYDLNVEYLKDESEACYVIHITLYSNNTNDNISRDYIIK